jgi:hypothetical protein
MHLGNNFLLFEKSCKLSKSSLLPLIEMKSITSDLNFDLEPIDVLLSGSGGMQDAVATWISVAVILPVVVWWIWRH